MDNHKASAGLHESHILYAPGLKRRPRANGPEARYFVVPAKYISSGYPIRTMTIPAGTSEAECASMCRRYWDELVRWTQDNRPKAEAFTFAWLISDYLSNPASAFRTVREGTREDYEKNCRIIAATIGPRHLDFVKENGKDAPRFTGADVRRWHHEWGLPEEITDAKGRPVRDAWGNVMTRPTAPGRQRHLIVMLRILAKHAVVIAKPSIAAAMYFHDLLSELEFPTLKDREVTITREQVYAFADKADAMGYPSLAITTLAQFELIERRIHIIGWWEGKREQKQWRPGWVWQNIDHKGPDASWVIEYYQDKVGRVLRRFDLKTIPALLARLQAIPEDRRVGPVIIAERERKVHLRLPWTDRNYAVAWRQVARACGIPDEVWSMDMRASGGTEADLITDIPDRALQDAFGHRDPKTKDRYRRQKQRNAQSVVDFRQARANKEERS